MQKTSNNIYTADYKARVNRVLDYIENKFESQFSLDELASVANFSKFHFHRIFWAMTGETPFHFITRIRLEKAATLLLNNPGLSISDISAKCGYPEVSVFSRSFKSHFSISPTTFRQSGGNQSNISQQNSNIIHKQRNGCQTGEPASLYFCHETKTIKWRSKMKLNQSVEVKNLPKMTVAYIRHTGPYKGNEKLFESLFTRLCAWAGARGLMQQPDFKSLVIYHDDPSVTEEQKLRISVCITVPEDTKVDGEVGKMEVAAGKYVVARFLLGTEDYEQAWGWLFGSWFPDSGYQPDDGYCFEMYSGEPVEGKMLVDICVPVKPL